MSLKAVQQIPDPQIIKNISRSLIKLHLRSRKPVKTLGFPGGHWVDHDVEEVGLGGVVESVLESGPDLRDGST